MEVLRDGATKSFLQQGCLHQRSKQCIELRFLPSFNEDDLAAKHLRNDGKKLVSYFGVGATAPRRPWGHHLQGLEI